MAHETSRSVTLGLMAAALSFGAVLATPTLAQDRQMQRRGGPDFAAMDTNADGTISAEERRAYAAQRMASLDADGDGKISRAEYQAHAGTEAAKRASQAAGSMFDTLDADGDDVLTAAEALEGGGLTRMLSRVDQNGDGIITPDERQAMRQMRGGEKAGRGDAGAACDDGKKAERRGEGRRGEGRGDHAPRWMQRG